MSVTLQLSPETVRLLQEKAARSGQSLAAYLQQLAETDAQGQNGSALADAHARSPADFDRCLEDLSAGLPAFPALPADWSRADAYADHD